MGAKRTNDYLSIKDIMQDVLKENRLQKGIDIVDIKEAWADVMGSSISGYTKELQYKNHTLIVTLNSSVLREELSYGKDKIIKLLNEKLNKVLIKNVKLK